jgi:hypothetical protein
MEPLTEVISDLVRILVEDFKVTPEEAQAEAERIELNNRREITEVMSRGYGTLSFRSGLYRYDAILDSDGISRLKRSMDV